MKFRSRAKLKALELLGVGGNGRNLHVRSSDIFIVGYPKSGNTWLDFLVACVISERVEDVNFKSINTIVGDIHALSPWQLHRLKNPRYLKSHNYFTPKYSKVVHIVRHPYDVAVSYYYFLLKGKMFDESYSLSEFVTDWVEGKWGEGYGTWEFNTRSWIAGASVEKRHFIFYEDLKKDTIGELSKVVDFLGIQVSADKVSEAVTWCQPENMNRLEKEGFAGFLKGVKGDRADIEFVRTAQSRKRASLSDKDKEKIAAAWQPLMDELGYDI